MYLVVPTFSWWSESDLKTEAKMKEPEPYRDADIWFSETEEEEETDSIVLSQHRFLLSLMRIDLCE